jgi:hypothetical protein
MAFGGASWGKKVRGREKRGEGKGERRYKIRDIVFVRLGEAWKE